MKKIVDVRRNVPIHWVGDGFPVRSMFSYVEDAGEFDPFLLLDYGGPYEFAPASSPRGVGEHPHRGFETVTIVYQGELEHRDSGGNKGTIGPGDVQWMTAASGVVHEEFHSEQFTRTGGMFEVVQLWVNLPAKDKMSPPRYQAILNNQIPSVPLPENAGIARVITGTLQGVSGPAKTFTPVRLWDLRLKAGHSATLPVPENDTALLLVQRGRLKLNGSQSAGQAEIVRFDRSGSEIQIEAQEEAIALLLSGQPIEEPVVGHGPFVMNTREQIQQAIRDYQSGKMGHLA